MMGYYSLEADSSNSRDFALTYNGRIRTSPRARPLSRMPRKGLVSQPLMPPWKGHEKRQKEFLRVRLELINLLLAHGSDPGEKCIMLFMCHCALRDERLEKCKGRPLRECVPLLAKTMPDREFWDGVPTAFKEHRKKHTKTRALLARRGARVRVIFSTE
ncbi:hypothetical protein GGTG_03427 [Gaeumannomyces tritici R3-111a-1]|uniref:Uncharacterized protein n=1 Tax=Gaeumannomyces tritici (strain R3-111a-1) TaxID=644352 RepID=J3NQ70_GAET3|nr:hypothetical protein GGTG_03427 [Gaeumannomyces tritici R3-111a-1]EJT78326.1 hypothetical protein GGTG_03427 [Gaeumannomyces tritici R3-111a-1]